MELNTDSCKAGLLYFKKKGGSNDKMIEQIENASALWADVTKQVPLTTNSLVPLVKVSWMGFTLPSLGYT